MFVKCPYFYPQSKKKSRTPHKYWCFGISRIRESNPPPQLGILHIYCILFVSWIISWINEIKISLHECNNTTTREHMTTGHALPPGEYILYQWQIATDSNGIYGLMSWPLDNFASIARFCFSEPLYLSE